MTKALLLAALAAISISTSLVGCAEDESRGPGQGTLEEEGTSSDSDTTPTGSDPQPDGEQAFGLIGTPQSSEYLNAIAASPTGRFFVAGGSDGALSPSGGDGGGGDAIVAEVEWRGEAVEVLWLAQFGSSTPAGETARALTALGDDTLAVGGTTYGDMGTSLGPAAEPWTGDAFVSLVSLSGEPLWTRVFGSSGEDYLFAIAADASGNIYATGRTMGGVFEGETAKGDADGFVARLSGKGDLSWVRQLGTAGFDEPRGIVATNSAVFLAGATLGPAADDTHLVFWSKLDPQSGEVLWTKSLDTPGTDIGMSLALRDETLLVAGVCDDQGCLLEIDASTGEVERQTTWAFDRYAEPSSVAFVGARVFTSGTVDPLAFLSGEQGDAFLGEVTPGVGLAWSALASTLGDEWSYGVAADGAGQLMAVVTTHGDLVGGTGTDLGAGTDGVIWARRVAQ